MTSREELKMEVMLKKGVKFNIVYHCADIHMERTNKREEEYREVFKEYINTIQKGVDRGEKAIAVICGDIFDMKNNISTNACKLLQDFLEGFPIPVIVIAGNHDMNAMNTDQTDALTAAIGYGLKNIYYLRESGYYQFGNIWFGVFSLIDGGTPDIKDLEGEEGTKIALYHGTLNGALIENGLALKSNKSTSEFKGWDYVLLGDIHKPQYLNEEKTMAYPGSLIMRNYGESLDGHGAIRWNIDAGTSKYIEIKNNYGFHTLQVKKGKIVSSLKEIREYPSIQLVYSDTTPEQLKKVECELKEKYGKKLVGIIASPKEIKNTKSIEIEKLRTGKFLSSEIIKEYYKEGKIKRRKMEMLVKYHRECRSKLLTDTSNNLLGRWRPKKLYFTNMFNHKGNWSFEFPDGVLGLFGNNGSGKSAVIEILLLAAYDKSVRSQQLLALITEGCTTCRIFLEFEQGGHTYCVYRSGRTLDRYRTVNGEKVKIVGLQLTPYLWEISRDKSTNICENQRNKTNAKLKEIVGDYKQMLEINTMTQSCDTGFADDGDMGKSKRLNEITRLNKFQSLDDIAGTDKLRLNNELKIMDRNGSVEENEKNKAEKKELKQKKEKMGIKLERHKRLHDDYSLINIREVDKMRNKLGQEDSDKRLTRNNKELKELSNKLKNLLQRVVNNDWKKMELLENELEKSRELEEKFIKNGTISTIKCELMIRINKLGGKCDLLKKCKRVLELREEMEMLRHEIMIAENAKNDLIGHKYDKNCEFCCDNKVVKNAKKYKNKLPGMEDGLKVLKAEYAKIENAPAKLEEYIKLENKFNEEPDEIRNYEIDIEWAKRHMNKLSVCYISPQLEKMRKDGINEMERVKCKERIEELKGENKILAMMGEMTMSEIETLREDYEEIQEEYNKIYERIIRLSEKIEAQNELNKEIEEKREELECVSLYKDAVGPNGIPQQLAKTLLPELVIQVNSILSEITLCRIGINITKDGPEIKLVVDANGKEKGMENGRHVKNCSGSEKLLIELALRAVMSLRMPQTADILILDESLKSLDKDKNMSLGKLLNALKGYFRTILVISHTDEVKDVMDKQVAPVKIKEEDWKNALSTMPASLREMIK